MKLESLLLEHLLYNVIIAQKHRWILFCCSITDFPSILFFSSRALFIAIYKKKGQIEESKEILLLRLTHLLFFGWMMRVCNANVQMAVSPIVVEVLHFKCTIYFLCCEKSAPRVHGSNVFCLYSPLCWAFFFHPKELCHPCSSLVRQDRLFLFVSVTYLCQLRLLL